MESATRYGKARIIRNMRQSANAIVAVCLTALLAAACAGGGAGSKGRSSPVESQLLAEVALERGEYLVAIQQYLNVARQSSDHDFARKATELAWDYGYDAYALAAAERWARLQPEDPAAHAYLGRLYVRRNLPDKAFSSLELALGDAAARTDQDYALLAADLSGPWARRGLAILERYAQVYPDEPGIMRGIAELAAQTGDVDRAIAAARDTLALRPDWYTTRIWLARLLLLAGQQASAFEQMAFALEMNPGLELEVEFAQLLSLAGESDAALARLNRLAERHDNVIPLQLMRAAVLLQAGQVDAAEAGYNDLLRSGSCLNECLWQLGSIAYARGEFESALSYFVNIRSGDRLRQARLAASQCYVELGDSEAALQVLRDFAAGFPRFAFDMQQPQAAILASEARWDEALAVIDQALDFSPWNEGLWLYRGGLLLEAGVPDQALEAFRTAYELAPDDPATLNALGYTLTVMTRRYREAFTYISQAIEADPGNPAIMDSMGWVLFKLGRHEEARDWLERAYAIMEDPEIAAHLGEVLWTLNERVAALMIWQTALQRFPGDPELLATMQRLQR